MFINYSQTRLLLTSRDHLYILMFSLQPWISNYCEHLFSAVIIWYQKMQNFVRYNPWIRYNRDRYYQVWLDCIIDRLFLSRKFTPLWAVHDMTIMQHAERKGNCQMLSNQRKGKILHKWVRVTLPLVVLKLE